MVSPRAYWRFPVVVYRFLPLILAYLRDRRRFLLFGRSREVTAETRVRRAERLLDTLFTLGPTFVKLGQILSTRPDVLPPEYIDVLSRLQDDVPPAPWEESRVVLEDALGPVEETFDSFDTDPISGASLGQVYVATYEGERVAVKVRRPGVEELVNADLRVIKWALPVIARFVERNQAFSLENLAEEFDRTINQEMDYDRERAMLREIRENFADDEDVIIPRPIDALSGPTVLTMEYVPGTKITDVEALDAHGIDRTALATKLQRMYLQMIVEDGVFHADPHPGNLAVTDDGELIFYDFGMSGYVDAYVQERIVDFYVAIANGDIDRILDALVALGTLSPEADRNVMADVMELAIADIRGEQIEQYRVQRVIERVESTIYDFPLRLPQNMALILRVATVVEGVCVTLDPDFDFVEVATEFLREQGYLGATAERVVNRARDQTRRTAEALVTVPPKLDDVLDTVQREDLTINVTLEDDERVIDRLARRIAYSILTAVGLLSASIIYSFGTGATETYVAVAIVALTLPMGFVLYRSFRTRRRGLTASPQFTRQNLRQRQREATERGRGGDGVAAGADRNAALGTGRSGAGERADRGRSAGEPGSERRDDE